MASPKGGVALLIQYCSYSMCAKNFADNLYNFSLADVMFFYSSNVFADFGVYTGWIHGVCRAAGTPNCFICDCCYITSLLSLELGWWHGSWLHFTIAVFLVPFLVPALWTKLKHVLHQFHTITSCITGCKLNLKLFIMISINWPVCSARRVALAWLIQVHMFLSASVWTKNQNDNRATLTGVSVMKQSDSVCSYTA